MAGNDSKRGSNNENPPPAADSAGSPTERFAFGRSQASKAILPDPPVKDETKLVQLVTAISERHGVTDVHQGSPPETRPPIPLPEPPEPRPISPVAPREVMPLPGELVDWNQNFRAELPEYVGNQIREYMHIHRMTSIAFTMRLLEQFRDEEHSRKRPFYIRKEDLIGDRRKTRKSR